MASIIETDHGFVVVYGDDEREGPFAQRRDAEQFRAEVEKN